MKLMLEKPNFLILDEPTNHLDIYSREILEEALEDYPGTILVVSHDRNFLDCVVNSIYEVRKDGASLFKGDYNSYLAQRDNPKESSDEKAKAVLSYEEQKKIKNRISSLERKISQSEEEISDLEDMKSKKQIEYDQAGKVNDLDKLLEIQEELEELDTRILEIMEQWEEMEKELTSLKTTL